MDRSSRVPVGAIEVVSRRIRETNLVVGLLPNKITLQAMYVLSALRCRPGGRGREVVRLPWMFGGRRHPGRHPAQRTDHR